MHMPMRAAVRQASTTDIQVSKRHPRAGGWLGEVR